MHAKCASLSCLYAKDLPRSQRFNRNRVEKKNCSRVEKPKTELGRFPVRLQMTKHISTMLLGNGHPDVWIDMCIGMCVDMCIELCTGMSMHIFKRLFRACPRQTLGGQIESEGGIGKVSVETHVWVPFRSTRVLSVCRRHARKIVENKLTAHAPALLHWGFSALCYAGP